MSGKAPPPLKPKPKFAPEVVPKKPDLAGAKIHSTSKREISPDAAEIDITSLRGNLKKTGRKFEDLETISRVSSSEESEVETKKQEVQIIRPGITPRNLPPPVSRRPSNPVINGIKLPSMDELSSKTSSINLDKSSADLRYDDDGEMDDSSSFRSDDKSDTFSARTKQQPSLPPKRHKFANNGDEPAPPSLPSRPRPQAKVSPIPKSVSAPMKDDSTIPSNDDDEDGASEDGDLESDEEDRPPLPQRPGASKPKASLPSKPKASPNIPSKIAIPEKPYSQHEHDVPKRPTSHIRSEIPSRPPLRNAISRDSSYSDDMVEAPKASPLPPPPPKPRARNSTPPAVPPSRVAAAASVQPSKELDLELETEWFTKEDLTSNLPKCFHNKDYSYSYGKTNGNNFVTIALREPDLSTVKVKLVWKGSSNIQDTLNVKEERIPPPIATREQLAEGASKFGEHVASWCESKEGKKVGDGECWTLARDALKLSCGKFAFVSSGYVHGALLSTYTGVGANTEPKIVRANPTDDIKRGDIIQFTSASFRYPNKALFFGAPHHTSIVLGVKGTELAIAHQNVNEQKFVSRDTIDISKLAEGELKIFRPITATWIKELDSL